MILNRAILKKRILKTVSVDYDEKKMRMSSIDSFIQGGLTY